MALNVAVQMDPIDRINIRGDSTFALLLEAQARSHPLSYYTPDKLSLRDGKVSASVRPLVVRDTPGDHFALGEARHVELSSFDVILLRQDPPFDLAYITSTHMLERVHPKTLVVNDPAHVRNAPEKVFVTEFPDLMPPTLVTRDLDAIKTFRAEHGDIVMKPLYGKGGEGVFLLTREDLNFGSLYDLFSAMFRERMRTMPEEINRIVTDSISDLFLVTEESGRVNLLREGIAPERIHMVGNLMIDSLRQNVERAKQSDIANRLGIGGMSYGVVTLHRPANVDDPAALEEILGALRVIAESTPLFWPVHPRTRARLENSPLPLPREMRLLEPLGYLDFLALEAGATLVLTDSGGIQEETTVLGVNCLTLRDNTERPVTIELGTNRLAGTKKDTILAAWNELRNSPRSSKIPPLWDGQAGQRSREVLRQIYVNRDQDKSHAGIPSASAS